MSDYGHELEFGVFVTPSAQFPDRVVALAMLADEVGLDLVTFQDHPYQATFLETWTLLSFVAARTTRVRLAANVLNLPLRPPAVVARAVASLDLLSDGRAELGTGAGGFWDAIDLIRSLWAVDQPGRAGFAGKHYQLAGAARGPAPLHRIGIWVGAYKPRMLDLVGRKADGWLPSLPYLKPGQLAEGNAAIDEAALEAGRKPSDIRRLLNLGGSLPPAELTRLAVEDGIGTFIVMADDPDSIRTYATEVAPAVREAVAAKRSRTGRPGGPARAAATPAVGFESKLEGESEYDRLGITPTPDDGTRLSAKVPWDESTRPHRPRSGPEVTYTERGRQIGKHLVDVHDSLRTELTELRDILAQVRDGAMTAGAARSALNEMALRQNDWALGAFCSRYCGIVTQHHGIEDASVFPHLEQNDPELPPVIQRLTQEHLVIHDAIEAVDAALVRHINHADGFDRIQAAIDFLTDSLRSHLSYEEQELVEPLVRIGFYSGQV